MNCSTRGGRNPSVPLGLAWSNTNRATKCKCIRGLVMVSGKKVKVTNLTMENEGGIWKKK